MSNVRAVSHTQPQQCERLHVHVYVHPQRYTKHASSQREEPSREIILTRSHIRATADGYESIKISHREPRVGRGNISNIRRADPFPAPHPVLDHHPHWSPCIIHLLSSSLIAPCCLPFIRTFIISAREKHFLSTAPARISRTRAVNFSFPSPYKRFSFPSFSPSPFPPPMALPLSVSLFPSLAHFLRRFPRYVAWA